MIDPGILIPGLVLAALAVAVLAWRLEVRRRRRLAAAAAKLGLDFRPARDRELARRFESLRGLDQGSDRYARHVMTGTIREHALTVFEFHYETHSSDSKGGRSTHHHYSSVFVLHLPRRFPSVVIAPEGVLSKIAQAFGCDDIDFESYEFSRAFVVRSPDKRFAYDFCHPAMIEFLLANRGITLQVEGDALAALYPGTMAPESLESRIDLLVNARRQMPASLIAN